MAQIVKADMRHIQIFKQLSKLGRYPRRGDRGTVRLRYNKVIVIVWLSVFFCLDVYKRQGLLPEHLTRYPHEFSGGQRQRIGLARAMVMEPEMCIRDR